MSYLKTAPDYYTEERAKDIAKTLGEADADWGYTALRGVDAPGWVVRVTDEDDGFCGFWNDGGTSPTPPPPSDVQRVDYHGDEGVKTLREWALAGGIPAAQAWAREHGEAWVLKADGSGFRLRRNCNAQGYSKKAFADVRPIAGLGS